MENIKKIISEIWIKVIGQETLIRDMLICLFSKWHILLEWAPWLAKTLAVSSLWEVVSLDFKRIQFTPDLLPSDLVWNKIYNPETKEFSIKKWPIFSNLILADEINRAPSKVQSALLEAMAEKQVTIWDETIALGNQFMVLATQNPLEQDGTYNLPEAQLDRFLLKTIIDYPTQEQELQIMKKYSLNLEEKLHKILKKADLEKIQTEVLDIHVEDNIFEYVKNIVFCSREDEEIKKYLLYWASPRASISIIKAAKALAFLNWRDFVLPEDVKEITKPVLRHRLILNYESIAEELTPDFIIDKILDKIKLN